MAETSNKDSPVVVIASLKIKPEKVARALELWHEQNAYLDSSEPPGAFKISTYRSNSAENEYIVVEEYVYTAEVVDTRRR